MNCLKKIMLSVSLLLMAVSLFAQKDITVSGTCLLYTSDAADEL